MSPTTDPGQGPPQHARFVLATYFLDRRLGRDPRTLDALCAAHPELDAELRRLREHPSAAHLLSALESLSQPTLDDDHPPLHERLASDAPRNGRFQVGDAFDQGAMGEIRDVWDRELRRSLAMKRMLFERGAPGLDDAEYFRQLARFLDEAQITGQLQHPGIVPVHDVGIDEQGHAYFTMRRVRGANLREIFARVRDGQDGWNTTRALNVLLRVCEAMAFAHAKGVVHRDLKPANVMVGRYGEVYVMDWGLAKVVGRDDPRDLRIREASTLSVHTDRQEAGSEPDSPLVTEDGAVVGTPAYMPPEQAGGQIERVGTRSDVYAVGAILYELLTGRMPYAVPGMRKSPRTILHAVLEGPPKPIHEIDPKVAPELVAICEKAMATDPAQRFADMREFAGELQSFLELRVVRSYQTGAVAEFRKWVRRNRGMAASLLAAIVIGALGLLVALGLERSRGNEIREKLDALQVRELLAQAKELWPRRPQRIPAIDTWLAASRSVLGRLPEHERKLARVRADAMLDPRATEELVDGLHRLRATEAEVVGRREYAVALARTTVLEQEAAWAAAIAAVRTAHGFTLSPQPGLVPLGTNAQGFQEFWHVESGARPARDPATQELVVDGETGIVLVLLPGGSVTVGAQSGEPLDSSGDVRVPETRVEGIAVAPFIVAKYELTQGQWSRATGGNPSLYQDRHRRVADAAAHPVEFVRRAEARDVLFRMGLEIPSEVQWEYAARAGTTTPYWCGNAADIDPAKRKAGNVADLSHDGFHSDATRGLAQWNDEFPCHAPVGRFLPNGFGLHDTIGNVWEMCRWGDGTTRIQDLDPDLLDESVYEIVRGGAFDHPAGNARSSGRRHFVPAGGRFGNIGVRPICGVTE